MVNKYVEDIIIPILENITGTGTGISNKNTNRVGDRAGSGSGSEFQCEFPSRLLTYAVLGLQNMSNNHISNSTNSNSNTNTNTAMKLIKLMELLTDRTHNGDGSKHSNPNTLNSIDGNKSTPTVSEIDIITWTPL